LTPKARQAMKSELDLVGTQTAPLRLQGRINTMKHLLTGVAVVAALAFLAPVWAQPASPSGGNAVGLPGPNPGGPGLTPYSTGAPSASDTSSAMPPKHHHAYAHHVVSTHQMLHAHGPKSGTDTTAQLNQAELARLQAGDFSNPPAEPSNPRPPVPAPTSGGRMSTGGRATSAAPTH
jgi:hypothetical protein